MTGLRALLVVVLLLVAPGDAASDDIAVHTSVSRTALWVGSLATYTVTLTCRSGVDVLQEDLGADKLPLTGLQVASHSVDRNVLSDGRVRYVVAYQLRTFEPGTDALGVGDWTVRYVAGTPAPGASAPAQELRIPGAAIAWRSALPAALTTLEVRDARAPQPPPAWWQYAGSAGVALLTVAAGVFGWMVMTRVAAGRAPKPRRHGGKESARDFDSTLSALRQASVANPGERKAAYATLEAAVRRRAGDLGGLPGAALTASEFQARFPAQPSILMSEELGHVLMTCERARYQPIDRLPGVQDFQATLDAAERVFANAR
jgi:hypothetical protein